MMRGTMKRIALDDDDVLFDDPWSTAASRGQPSLNSSRSLSEVSRQRGAATAPVTIVTHQYKSKPSVAQRAPSECFDPVVGLHIPLQTQSAAESPATRLSALLLTTNPSHRESAVASWVEETTPQWHDGAFHAPEMCVVPLSPQPHPLLEVNEQANHNDVFLQSSSNNADHRQDEAVEHLPVDWTLVVQLHRMVLQHQALIDQLSIELALERGGRISLEEKVAELEASLSHRSESGLCANNQQAPEANEPNKEPVDAGKAGAKAEVPSTNAVEEVARCPSVEANVTATPLVRIHHSVERQPFAESSNNKQEKPFPPPNRHVFTSAPASFVAAPTCASSLPSRPRGSQKMWTEVVKEVEPTDY